MIPAPMDELTWITLGMIGQGEAAVDGARKRVLRARRRAASRVRRFSDVLVWPSQRINAVLEDATMVVFVALNRLSGRIAGCGCIGNSQYDCTCGDDSICSCPCHASAS